MQRMKPDYTTIATTACYRWSDGHHPLHLAYIFFLFLTTSSWRKGDISIISLTLQLRELRITETIFSSILQLVKKSQELEEPSSGHHSHV